MQEVSNLVTIRKATLVDLPAITDIYNEAILNTTATFDTQPKTLSEQQVWYDNHQHKHPILVAEQGSLVVGWASLSKWSDRCAYSDTSEASIYIRKEYRGKGTGKLLLKRLIQEGKNIQLHTVIARIAGDNQASIKLFRSIGFQDIGTMKEVGCKFGKLLDVNLLQKIYY